EARAAAGLSHPNVVAVHEIDEHDGIVYLVMELAAGGSVQSLIRQRGALTWREASRLIAGACRGLVAAHAAGLIHRDVKPANLLVGTDGRARMTDFGLVRVAASEEAPPAATGDDRAAVAETSPLTRTGSLLGTPVYMSPEQ